MLDSPDVSRGLNALKLQLARDRLVHLACHIDRRYRADPLHQVIAAHLEAVLRSEIRRLMIFSFPQSGKSRLASEFFPAYWLAHRPDEPILLASYAAELAEERSRRARYVVESEEYAELFPSVATRSDSRAANRWYIAGHEGGMRSAGVEGGIAGKPAGLGIIDDPIAKIEEAFSPARLELIWRWWEMDFNQRLWETAPVILIMTRWHEDDLAGRILRSKEAADWTVLRIPALSETQTQRDEENGRLGLPAGLPDPLGRMEEGLSAAPTRWSAEYLRGVRDKGSSQYRWHALYQGSPRPPEGSTIKREWLTIVAAAPAQVVRRVRYWDKAASLDSSSRTAGVLMSKTADGLIYIEDVVYGQWEAHERNAIMKQTAFLDATRYVVYDVENPGRPLHELPGYNTVRIYMEIEPGSGGKESGQLSVKELAGFPVYGDRVSGKGTKDVRLDPFVGYAGAGNVRLVRGRWNEAYIAELTALPHGTFRDMADATAAAFNLISLGGLSLGYASGVEE